MKFIANAKDPKVYGASAIVGFSQSIEWLKWIEGKYVGDPQDSEVLSVEQLKDQNIAGIYIKEFEDETTDMPPLSEFVTASKFSDLKNIEMRSVFFWENS